MTLEFLASYCLLAMDIAQVYLNVFFVFVWLFLLFLFFILFVPEIAYNIFL